MRICIVGAGGLGSVVGGCLAESGVDVTLVGRAAHVEAIAARGLRMTGLRGERRIVDHVSAVADPGAAEGRFDFLILVVKAKDTATALAEASGLRERVDCALSLQNTLSKEDELSAWIGTERVIGASSTESGVLEGPGVVRHIGTAPVSHYFGELDGRPSPRIDAIVDAFSRAGFASKPAPDIRHVEWEKLLQMASINLWSVSTLGVMPGGSIAEGFTIRPAAQHYVRIAREMLEIYASLGYEPQDFFHPYARFRELSQQSDDEATRETMAEGRRMLDAGIIGRASLHVDLMRGARTEVDQLVAPFLERADEMGLSVPTVRACDRILRTLEQMLT